MREFARAANMWKVHDDQDGPLISYITREFRLRETKCQMHRFGVGGDIPLLSISCLLCPRVCVSFEILALAIDSPLSIGRRQKRSECQRKNPWKFRGSERNGETGQTFGQGTSHG
jgi:hypothetical protein